MSNIKLNLIKTITHQHNKYSKLLVENLQKNNNLLKINWTTKKMESFVDEKPYLSYLDINGNEKKIYNFNSINEFLNKISIPLPSTTLVYDTMME